MAGFFLSKSLPPSLNISGSPVAPPSSLFSAALPPTLASTHHLATQMTGQLLCALRVAGERALILELHETGAKRLHVIHAARILPMPLPQVHQHLQQ
jgi:hypothetical protein